MRQSSLMSFICLLCFFSCDNKDTKESGKPPIYPEAEGVIQKFMRSADSIILVSHREPTNAPPDPETGEPDPDSELFIKGKLSRSLIIKAKKLDGTNIVKLGQLLDKPAVDDISYTKCFSPRNAILVYKSTQIFYLDVCFECKGIAMVGFPVEPQMSQLKYDELERFFDEQTVR